MHRRLTGQLSVYCAHSHTLRHTNKHTHIWKAANNFAVTGECCSLLQTETRIVRILSSSPAPGMNKKVSLDSLNSWEKIQNPYLKTDYVCPNVNSLSRVCQLIITLLWPSEPDQMKTGSSAQVLFAGRREQLSNC